MRKFSALISGLLLCSTAALAQSAPSVLVAGSAPTTNVDGSTITATLTYNLYQSVQGGTLVKVQGPLTTLSATVTAGLTPGSTQCFTFTAIEGGNESAKAPSACAAIPLPTPNAPSQITVVVH